jgi:predicted MFS family arabinose efflux permease
MARGESLKVAFGGLMAMAAALGIGRFVYTPILPFMLDALGWSKADAGLVASANFLGYLAGAMIASVPVFSSSPRTWLLIALAASATTTAGMGLLSGMVEIVIVRLIGGVASAFVIVCASTLVLDRLSAAGRGNLVAIHFAGVGAGIFVSAVVVAAGSTNGAGWQSLWIASGLVAALAALLAATLLRSTSTQSSYRPSAEANASKPVPVKMIAAYGLFGFGYVITATFLVTIVRQSLEIRSLEPWIWMLFGFSALPSVPLWQGLGRQIGLMRAYAIACAIEATGIAASVDWVTISGVCVSAVLLGGTFMGLTALGLMSGRALAGGQPQRLIGLMTASFGAGQMVGPYVAGILAEVSGGLRLPSRLASGALVIAALLAIWSSAHTSQSIDSAKPTC